jgi:hypothetical protein
MEEAVSNGGRGMWNGVVVSSQESEFRMALLTPDSCLLMHLAEGCELTADCATQERD